MKNLFEENRGFNSSLLWSSNTTKYAPTVDHTMPHDSLNHIIQDVTTTVSDSGKTQTLLWTDSMDYIIAYCDCIRVFGEVDIDFNVQVHIFEVVYHHL